MILAVGDLHLSTAKPLCRTDADWVASQKEYLDFVYEQVKANNAKLCVAGDVFDTPTVAPVMVNMVLGFLHRCSLIAEVSIIAGNHDLPYHNVEKLGDSSFGALRELIRNNHMDNAYDFGTEVPDAECRHVMLHHYAVPTKDDVLPNRDCYTVDDLIEMYPRANIIITGDNHTPWSVKRRNKLVVNCGTLIKRNATEYEHKCGVWLIDDEHIEAKYIDYSEHNDGCIDLSYLKTTHELEDSREQYKNLVEELKGGMEESYDFPSVLSQYVADNRKALGDGVSDILEDVIGFIKGKEEKP